MKTYGFTYKPHAPERFLFDFNSGGRYLKKLFINKNYII
jgi:hypothetical protein